MNFRTTKKVIYEVIFNIQYVHCERMLTVLHVSYGHEQQYNGRFVRIDIDRFRNSDTNLSRHSAVVKRPDCLPDGRGSNLIFTTQSPAWLPN